MQTITIEDAKVTSIQAIQAPSIQARNGLTSPAQTAQPGILATLCSLYPCLATLCSSSSCDDPRTLRSGEDDNDEQELRPKLDAIVSPSLIQRLLASEDIHIEAVPNPYLGIDKRMGYAPYLAFAKVYEELVEEHPDFGEFFPSRPAETYGVLQFLWHGTKTENVASIMEKGFVDNRDSIACESEPFFWFSPEASMFKDTDGDYSLVLCATLLADWEDENRFKIPATDPDHVLPLAAGGK